MSLSTPLVGERGSDVRSRKREGASEAYSNLFFISLAGGVARGQSKKLDCTVIISDINYHQFHKFMPY